MFFFILQIKFIMKTRVLRSAVLTALFVHTAASSVMYGQGTAPGLQGVNTALRGVDTGIRTLFPIVTNIMLVIMAIVGVIAAIQVYSKWSSGDPDVRKSATQWFGALIFAGIVLLVINAVFGTV